MLKLALLRLSGEVEVTETSDGFQIEECLGYPNGGWIRLIVNESEDLFVFDRKEGDTLHYDEIAPTDIPI